MTIVWALIVLALAALLITRNCRRHNDVLSPGQINTGRAILPSAVGLFGLLASPVSWTHHWVWALPAIITLFTITVSGNRSAAKDSGAVDSPYKQSRRRTRQAKWYAILAGIGSGVFLMGTVWWSPLMSRRVDALTPEAYAQMLSHGGLVGHAVNLFFSVFIGFLENSYVVWAGFAFVTLASVAWSPAQRRRRNTRTCQLHR